MPPIIRKPPIKPTIRVCGECNPSNWKGQKVTGCQGCGMFVCKKCDKEHLCTPRKELLDKSKQKKQEQAFPVSVVTPEAEVFRVEEDTSNLILLDCGATQNLVGSDTVDKCQERALDEHRAPGLAFDGSNRKDFKFGNDAVKESNGVCLADANIAGRDLTYTSHVIPGGAPWLGSIEFLRESGAIVDFSTDRAIFSRLNPDQVIKLRRLASGHLALPLNGRISGELETEPSDPVLKRMLRK